MAARLLPGTAGARGGGAGGSGSSASTPGSAGVMATAASVSSKSASKSAAAAAAISQATASYRGTREPPVTAVPWSSHRPSSTAGASRAAVPVPPAEWRKQTEAYRAARGASVATETGTKARGSPEGAPEKGTGDTDAGFREGSAFSAPATAGSAGTAAAARAAAVARTAASAAAGQSRRLEQMQREEQQRLHSPPPQQQQQRALQLPEEKAASSQREFHGRDHSRPSKIVLPPLAGRHSPPALPPANLRALHAAASLVSGGASKGGTAGGPSSSQNPAAFRGRSPSGQAYLDQRQHQQHQQQHQQQQQQQRDYQQASGGGAAPRRAQSPNVTYIHMGPSATHGNSNLTASAGATADFGGDRSEGGSVSSSARGDDTGSVGHPSPRSAAHTPMGGRKRGGSGGGAAGDSLGASGNSGRRSSSSSSNGSISSAGNGGNSVDVRLSASGGGGGDGGGVSQQGRRAVAVGYKAWGNSQALTARSQSSWGPPEGYAGLTAEGGGGGGGGGGVGGSSGSGGNGAGRQMSSSPYGVRPQASSPGVTVPGFGAITAGAGLHVRHPPSSESQDGRR
ncbi:unnamed protein product [Laminaria digitata]